MPRRASAIWLLLSTTIWANFLLECSADAAVASAPEATCGLTGTCDATPGEQLWQESPPKGVQGLWELLRVFSAVRPDGAPPGHLADVNFSMCNIEKVSLQKEPDRAVEMLRMRMLSSNQELPLPPIILTDLRSSSAQKMLAKTWGNGDWLLDQFGDFEINAGPPVRRPVVDRKPLKDYVSYMRSHPVDLDANSTNLDFDFQFKRALKLPPKYWKIGNLELDDKALEDFLTPPEMAYQQKLLGLPFHAHGPAVNEVVSGKKFWLFYPKYRGCNDTEVELGGPASLDHFVPPAFRAAEGEQQSAQKVGVHSCHSIVQHVSNSYVSLDKGEYLKLAKSCREGNDCSSQNVQSKSLFARWVVDAMPHLPEHQQPPFRCSVSAGEAMVVPHYSWHATLNLEETAIFIRGATETDPSGGQTVPRCSRQFDGGKVLVQLWNIQKEDAFIYWRNTSSGKAKRMHRMAPQGTQELRTFVGLKFTIWLGPPEYGDQVGVFTVGEPMKPRMKVGGRLTDMSQWDHCNFQQT